MISENNNIIVNVDAINYRNTPRQVYMSIDDEYLQMDSKLLTDYLNVGLGMLSSACCG